jgi:dTDP-4-amino-4,6-dideoxygalactose transaminase
MTNSSPAPQLIDSTNNGHLAIDGGQPVRAGAFSPWPFFDDELCAASDRVLRSGKVNYWTGNEGKLFEQEYAAAIGSQHAIALTNGTVALELALYGLGIGAGDEVIVPSRTFIASASCAVMRGAKPVIADLDRDSQNLTVETIRAVTTSRTKAIVAVHLAGWPCDLDPIMEFANEHGIKVIEDCAQSHGAMYKGRHLGSIGHVGAFSFCQDKIMTTGGEGGLMVTNDRDLWSRCWSLKDHGKSWDALQQPHQPHLFRWLHEGFGTNWRLTEAQSAMGRIMLKRLPEWIAARRQNAARLNSMLSGIDALRIPEAPSNMVHSYYKYYVFVRPEKLLAGWDRDRIVQAIQAEGVFCGPGSCGEIYLEKAFDAPGLRPAQRLPVAKELGETSLMFMVHPTLKAHEVEETGRAISKVMLAASGVSAVSPLVRRAA